MLIDSKSNLAKLMATENIIVEQKKVPTAYFNLKNRVLVIPQLKDGISSVLYDLFIGHEVGHALYTPTNGWHDSVDDLGVNRSILNVCEDSRIEKLIRRKYPGLKFSFIKAYRELLDRNFFGIAGFDINLLKLIDRINLHTKLGASLGIKFDEVEMNLLNEIENAETFNQTVEAAKKVQIYMQEQNEKQKQLSKDEDEQEELEKSTNGVDDSDYEDSDQSYEEDEEYDSDEESIGNETGTDKDVEYEENEQKGKDISLDSITDNTFRENEQDLYDYKEKYNDGIYGNIPNFNSDDVIIQYKKLYKMLSDYSANADGDYEYYKIQTHLFKDFRKESNKVVGYLAKEFELRKNAAQLKRASTSKTGELDMKSIYSYQFNEDIFKKITTVPEGKSHGLVLFLDWSGSMSTHIHNTIKQLLTLSMFCKKVMIPFEVYAFTDRKFPETNFENIKFKNGDIYFGKFALLNVLSSKMTSAEFSFAASTLLTGIHNKDWIYKNFGLNGTPLNEAIISAMDIIPKFQAKYKLQIVNTVFLTDGEGQAIDRVVVDSSLLDGNTNWVYSALSSSDQIIVRDTTNCASMKSNNSFDNSKAFLYLLKQRTGCNIIGFRILSGRELSQFLRHTHRGMNITPIISEFRKEKSTVIKSYGFDEYYLLKGEGLSTEENTELVVVGNTTRSFVKAFKGYARGHIQNRVILNRFISLIS